MAPVALITGAARGIGRATALGLAADGFDVWLNYRADHASAAETAAAVRALDRQCLLLPFDVRDAAAADAALNGPLDTATPYILVNNAGFARDTVFGLMSAEQWGDVLDVHLNGFFHVTRRVAPLMMRARQGRIVNMVSTAGQSGNPGQVNYSAAKSGLIGATKALARELARRNILVNAVAPGFIETDMTAGLNLDEHRKYIPQARAGTAEEVAACVRFLCSPGAGYITGHVLAVNGGLYM